MDVIVFANRDGLNTWEIFVKSDCCECKKELEGDQRYE